MGHVYQEYQNSVKNAIRLAARHDSREAHGDPGFALAQADIEKGKGQGSGKHNCRGTRLYTPVS